MTAPAQAPPDAAEAFYTQGQAITAAVLLALRNLWARFDPAVINGSFAAILGDLVATIAAGQVAAARSATGYVPALLAELGMDDGKPAGAVRPVAFIGSSSGLALPETLDTVRLRSLHAAAEGDDAAGSGLALLEGIGRTQVADAARLATSTEIAVRPWVTGYVRLLNTPSCKDCILLAGRFYLWSAGFERHPKCDCRHIPADEDVAGDLRTDPDAYFRSLSEAEQDRAFGKANAQAIRDGADMSQVVNIRGVSTAQVFRRDVRITASGTSSRGAFGRHPRLTPESIYKLADGNRDEAIRLLRRFAYIT